MIKTSKTILALLIVIFAISCKKAEEASESAYESNTIAVDTTNTISSSAAVEPKNSDRKFVRTADIKFKVKNVANSTYAIENTANKFGGFVTYTNLQSTVSDKQETKISQDSTLEITKYTVENNITIRVPNIRLDTVIKTIAKQIDFLEYRIIKADDVSLQMLSNQMQQNRSSNQEKRLEKAIDTKGKKLNEVIAAEDNLNTKNEQNDNAKLENLSLKDQVNFSTLTLQIYQRETIKEEMVANPKTYRQGFGSKILDGIISGWYVIEGIIAVIAQLWSVILIGIGGYIIFKKYFHKGN
ncbi:DUF4349 domain-containing protein [Flavobacterium alvei]|uniref:DUF4349 domain-containing protein n=1 Tax=Flavobacterium alvei TaxID=2080416 RepID=A0A2S5A0V7_9FLAO|nr:DUF4349 domain-containing protein [Flavobacterium alvei]POY36185.1 DUF4349 domain-containing protein [Flavobacterium alvei]HQE34427.1 DUF4349 domain-containing protein [Flavobacterium alvei]HQK39233.1 DUF4349 domain-containing protein [Flavobacterium alvei]